MNLDPGTWADATWMWVRIAIMLTVVLAGVPPVIWLERRLLAWMQDRRGPNRVGPWGLLQPLADGIKLIFKEEIVPHNVDRLIYTIAPAIALFPAFAIWAVIPWGPDSRLTPVADVDIGVLYILAISSLGVYGVFLAGWASNNKYSLLGGIRSSAQLISYELGMGVALASVVLYTGSLRMTEAVAAQFEPWMGVAPWLHNWFILTPYGFIAGVIFLICMVAETNRAPFDLPEAESELIAGFHTEYSSMKFAVFFMGEYAVMLAFSAVFAVMFMGGWSPLLNFEYLATILPGLAGVFTFLASSLMAPVWFFVKLFLGMFFYIWLRATLPRLRYDQLMNLGWKALLPLAALNFVLVAIWMQFGFVTWAVSAAVVVVVYLYFVIAYLRPGAEKRGVTLINEPAHTERTMDVTR